MKRLPALNATVPPKLMQSGCSPSVTHRTPPSHAANVSEWWQTLNARVVFPNPPVP